MRVSPCLDRVSPCLDMPNKTNLSERKEYMRVQNSGGFCRSIDIIM